MAATNKLTRTAESGNPTPTTSPSLANLAGSASPPVTSAPPAMDTNLASNGESGNPTPTIPPSPGNVVGSPPPPATSAPPAMDTNSKSNGTHSSPMEDINELEELIKSNLNDDLLDKPQNDKKAIEFKQLYASLNKFKSDQKYSTLATSLKTKAVKIISQPVKEILKNIDFILDGDSALALIMLNLSQSVNELALALYDKNTEDTYKEIMNLIYSKAFNTLELRGQFVKLGLNIPNDLMKNRSHWFKSLSEMFSSAENPATVFEYCLLDWEVVETILIDKNCRSIDFSKLEKLYTGELGTEDVASIRKQFRMDGIPLYASNYFEKKKRLDVSLLTELDLNEFEEEELEKTVEEKEVEEKEIMFDKIRTAMEKANSKSTVDVDVGSPENTEDVNSNTDEEDGFEDPTATDAMVKSNNLSALAINAETTNLIGQLDLSQDTVELQEKLEKIDILNQISEKAVAVGERLTSSNQQQNELLNKAPKFKSNTDGVASMIYKSNAEMVAGASGGQALHGVVLLVEDRAILTSSNPMLAEPPFVEMYRPVDAFRTNTFSTTISTEHSSFSKTANSGCLSMAEATSHSEYGSVSADGWGATVEGSINNSGEDKKESGLINDDKEETSTNVQTSKSYIQEYMFYPARSFRIPKGAMIFADDALWEIVTMDTPREGTSFIIKYGSHFPQAKQTLGGLFSKSIEMTSESKVSSVALFSMAGTTLQEEKASSLSVDASASYSGWGASVSASAGFNKSSVSGSKEMTTKTEESGGKNASVNCSYTVKISSLGPSATHLQDFYEQVETKPGTWAIVDRGMVDSLIPVWELMEMKLLPSKNSRTRTQMAIKAEHYLKKVLGDKYNGNSYDNQIRKAIFLTQSVWSDHIKLWKKSKHAPSLPPVINRSIADFLAIENAIGMMVKSICNVIIPTAKDDTNASVSYDRLAMINDLRTVVRNGANYILNETTFGFDNWWIEEFIAQGMKGNTEKLKFEFDVEIVISFDDFGSKQSKFIRGAHAEAKRASTELSREAWDRLYEKFIPLAKIAHFRHFRSSSDDARTAKVWYIPDILANENTAAIQTPLEKISLQPFKPHDILCPDSITSVTVDAISFDRTKQYEIDPGTSYYWFRKHSDVGSISNKIRTEADLMNNGYIIIFNPFPLSLTMKLTLTGSALDGIYQIRKFCVLCFEKKEGQMRDHIYQGKMSISHEYSQNNTANLVDVSMTPGNKYTFMFDQFDTLSMETPKLISVFDVKQKKRKCRGSLIISCSEYRRMHQWDMNLTSRVLNGINVDTKQYCSDQLWEFILTAAPESESEFYDLDEKCFLIVNKKSKMRLSAGIDEDDDELFVNGDAPVRDSHKWQLISHQIDELIAYEIINASSGRRLERSRVDTTEYETKNNTSEIAAIPFSVYEEYNYQEEDEKKHLWYILSYDLFRAPTTVRDASSQADLNSEVSQNDDRLQAHLKQKLPQAGRILSRQTLPGNQILEAWGIIINNNFEITFEIWWKGLPDEKFSLASRADVKRSRIAGETTDTIVIARRDDGTSNEISLTLGKEYFVYFLESDRLCLGLPELLEREDREEKTKNRQGAIILCHEESSDQLQHRLGLWTNEKDVFGLPSSDTVVSDDQLWDFESSSDGEPFFYIKNKEGLYMKADEEGKISVVEDVKEDDGCIWKIQTDSKDSNICSISNKTGNYLSLGIDHTKNSDFYKLSLSESECKWQWVAKENIDDVLSAPSFGEENPKKSTEFAEACDNQDLDLIQLQLWEDPSIKENPKYLLDAAKNGSISVLELLVNSNGFDVNGKDESDGGNTSLHVAAQNNNRKVVEKLIELGCDVTIENSSGEAAVDLTHDDDIRGMLLYFVQMCRSYYEVANDEKLIEIKHLVENRVPKYLRKEAKFRDRYGHYALFYVIQYCSDRNFVEKIFEKNKNALSIDDVDEANSAISQEVKEFIFEEFLRGETFQHSANLVSDFLNENSWTFESITRAKDYATIYNFFREKAQESSYGTDNNTILHIAVINDDLKLVQALKKLDPTLLMKKNGNNKTAYDLAEKIEMEQLLSLSVDVDFGNPDHDDKFDLRPDSDVSIRNDSPNGMGRALRCVHGWAKIKGVDISLSKMSDCTVSMAVYFERKALLEGQTDATTSGDILNGGTPPGGIAVRRVVMHDWRWKNRPYIPIDKSKWDSHVHGIYDIWEGKDDFLGKWIYLTAVFRKDGLSYLYLDKTKSDGVQRDSDDGDGKPDLYIGNLEDNRSNARTDCWVKEIAVFDRALSDEHIYALSDEFHMKPMKPPVIEVDFNNPNHNSKYNEGTAEVKEGAPLLTGKALFCDNTGDVKRHAKIPGCDISPSKMPDCTLTIGCYVKSKPADKHGWILSNENGGWDRAICMHDNRADWKPCLSLGEPPSNPWRSNVPDIVGRWIYVTAVFKKDGDNFMFIDRQKSAAMTKNNNARQDGSSDLYIGCNHNNPSFGCDCWVKEVKVFERVLTDDQIYYLSDQFHQNLPLTAPEYGVYKIKTTYNAQWDIPAGRYLQYTKITDSERSSLSNWVSNQGSIPSDMICEWELKPGKTDGTYRIDTNSHTVLNDLYPAGRGLSAWGNLDAEARRNESSIKVAAQGGDTWPMDWKIEPGSKPNTWRIFTTHHARSGTEPGYGLAVYGNAVARAIIDDESSWVYVDSRHGWHLDWEFEKQAR